MAIKLFNHLRDRAQKEILIRGAENLAAAAKAEPAAGPFFVMLDMLRVSFVDEAKSAAFEVSELVPMCKGFPKEEVIKTPFKHCWFEYKIPMFGSVKGTFWWAPHVRGSSKHGVVKKTYEVADDAAADSASGG